MLVAFVASGATDNHDFPHGQSCLRQETTPSLLTEAGLAALGACAVASYALKMHPPCLTRVLGSLMWPSAAP